MADTRVARPYAQALFDTAQKYDVVKSVESDLNSFVALLDNDEEFKEFVIAPYTGREEKIAIVDRIFSDRVTALTMQLLRVMLEKSREEHIKAVRDEFVKLRREAEGVIFATVITSEPIEDAQKTALLTKLQATLGKTIEAEFKIEPSLMGGIRVAYGNYVLDGSIHGSLKRLREALIHDALKQQ